MGNKQMYGNMVGMSYLTEWQNELEDSVSSRMTKYAGERLCNSKFKNEVHRNIGDTF